MTVDGDEIDGVVAGPELADDLQLGPGLQHPFADQVQAHDRRVAPGQEPDHLVLGEGAGQGVHPGVGIERQELRARAVGNAAMGHRHAELLDRGIYGEFGQGRSSMIAVVIRRRSLQRPNRSIGTPNSARARPRSTQGWAEGWIRYIWASRK